MLAKQGAKHQSKIVKPGSGKSINSGTIHEIVYDVMKNSCSESIDSGTIYVDMQLISRMPSCKWFRRRRTAENIQEEYENIIETFELHGKVSAVISDNALNTSKKALSRKRNHLCRAVLGFRTIRILCPGQKLPI